MDGSRAGLNGSMTVEASFLVPIILLLLAGSILAAFYFHDKIVIAGAAYETAVVGSTRMREPDGVDEGLLQAMFRERLGRKCILFRGCHAEIWMEDQMVSVYARALRGRFRVSVRACAAVTEPEKRIRDIRRIKRLTDGMKKSR